MFPAWISRLGLALICVVCPGSVVGSQDAQPQPDPTSTSSAITNAPPATMTPVDRAGLVTGDAVYVRSGPSQNHYVVTKLNVGDEVIITGEEGPWWSIKPPKGCFSLVSREYVDTSDGVRGVINGDRVNVRCGSHITSDQYQVQLQLSRGAEVTIIGEHEDGKYRIIPPPGARVFINKQYVRLRSPGEPQEAILPSSPDSPGSGTGRNEGEGRFRNETPSRPMALTGVAPVTPSPLPAPVNPEDAMLLGSSPTPLRQRLVALNARMREQMNQPMAQRQLSPLLAEYSAIAADSSDEVAARFATAKVSQLEYLMRLAQSAANLDAIVRDLEKEREAFIEARRKVAAPLIPPRAGFDAEGELRPSAVYSSTVGPRRMRLVDPKTQPARTIAYVELAPGVELDLDRYMGRYVGIEALRIRPADGTLNPVPVMTASRIELLEPEGASSSSVGVQP